MTMIEAAIDTLRAVQDELLASEAEYIRLGGGTKTVRAVPGRTVFRSVNDVGAWIRIETRDFIVAASALAAPPETGDVIRFRGADYEVLAPNGEPAWRWSDPYRTAYRIHTKHTGGEE